MTSREDRLLLDLVFIQDASSSHGSHVSTALAKIKEIISTIKNSGVIQQPDDLRVGIVAFQQGQRQRVIDFPFTSDTASVQHNVESLLAPIDRATVLGTFRKALDLPWRPDAYKLLLLVTDGFSEATEEPSGFPWGSPDDWKSEIPEWTTEEKKIHDRGIVFKRIVATSVTSLKFDLRDFFPDGSIHTPVVRGLPLHDDSDTLTAQDDINKGKVWRVIVETATNVVNKLSLTGLSGAVGQLLSNPGTPVDKPDSTSFASTPIASSPISERPRGPVVMPGSFGDQREAIISSATSSPSSDVIELPDSGPVQSTISNKPRTAAVTNPGTTPDGPDPTSLRLNSSRTVDESKTHIVGESPEGNFPDTRRTGSPSNTSLPPSDLTGSHSNTNWEITEEEEEEEEDDVLSTPPFGDDSPPDTPSEANHQFIADLLTALYEPATNGLPSIDDASVSNGLADDSLSSSDVNGSEDFHRPTTLPSGMRLVGDPEEPDVPFVPKVEVAEGPISEDLVKRMVYLHVTRKQRVS